MSASNGEVAPSIFDQRGVDDKANFIINVENVPVGYGATMSQHDGNLDALFSDLAKNSADNWPGHPKVAALLVEFAKQHADDTNVDEEESLYRRTLAIAEASYGPDNLDLATALISLADALKDANRPTKAEWLYCRALAIADVSRGPDDPRVQTDLISLANLRKDTDRPTKAE